MKKEELEIYEIPTIEVESIEIFVCPHQAACNGK